MCSVTGGSVKVLAASLMFQFERRLYFIDCRGSKIAPAAASDNELPYPGRTASIFPQTAASDCRHHTAICGDRIPERRESRRRSTGHGNPLALWRTWRQGAGTSGGKS